MMDSFCRLEAIHYRHVAVHQYQLVHTVDGATAWRFMNLGYPGPDLFKCLLSILSGITMSDTQFFQNELEGYDVE